APARRTHGRHERGGHPAAGRAGPRGAGHRHDGRDGRAPHGRRRRGGRPHRRDAPRGAAGVRHPRGRHGRRDRPVRLPRRLAVTATSPPPAVADTGDALLVVDDLHVHLGESHVLHGVTFDVPPGRVTAILGRNGVGKTTTLRGILGL